MGAAMAARRRQWEAWRSRLEREAANLKMWLATTTCQRKDLANKRPQMGQSTVVLGMVAFSLQYNTTKYTIYLENQANQANQANLANRARVAIWAHLVNLANLVFARYLAHIWHLPDVGQIGQIGQNRRIWHVRPVL